MQPSLPHVDHTLHEQPMSVAELTQHIKELLEGNFATVWVRGELSNIRKPPSGHIYASLKDEQAQIRIVMFRNALSNAKNGSSAFEWKEGVEVILQGRMSVYAPQGSYQIIVTHIEAVGSGALQAQFEALKKKLQALGWFDAQHKKPLPFLPRRVGVVTSPSGAAIRDIVNVIQRRFPTLAIDIYPAVVQGKEASPSIVQAIRLAESLHRVDVLIVGRGGGSIEDLWCFNDEALAKTIFECSLPVVSAVGHEIDFTICDFVADVRAPTPSAAAELVVPDQAALLAKYGSLHTALQHHIQQVLQFEKQRLDTLFHQLEHPRQKLMIQKQKCLQYFITLQTLFPQRLHQAKEYVTRLENVLASLNPMSVLSRGYALVQHQKTRKVISKAKDAKPQDPLQVVFSDGEINVIVTS